MATELERLEDRKWQHIMRLVAAVGERWMRYGQMVREDRLRQMEHDIALEQIGLQREQARSAAAIREIELAQSGKRSQMEAAIRLRELDFQEAKSLEEIRRYNNDLKLREEENGRRQIEFANRVLSERQSLLNQNLDTQQRYLQMFKARDNKYRQALSSWIGNPVMDTDELGREVPRLDPITQMPVYKLKPYWKKFLQLKRDEPRGDRKVMADLLEGQYGKLDWDGASGFNAFMEFLMAGVGISVAQLDPNQPGAGVTLENALKNAMPGNPDIEDWLQDVQGEEAYERAMQNWGAFVQPAAERYGRVHNSVKILEANIDTAQQLMLQEQESLNMGPGKGIELGSPEWAQWFRQETSTVDQTVPSWTKMATEVNQTIAQNPLGPSGAGDSEEERETLPTVITPRAQKALKQMEARREKALASIPSHRQDLIERVNQRYDAMEANIRRQGAFDVTDYQGKLFDNITSMEMARAMAGKGSLTQKDWEEIVRRTGPIPGAQMHRRLGGVDDEHFNFVGSLLGDQGPPWLQAIQRIKTRQAKQAPKGIEDPTTRAELKLEELLNQRETVTYGIGGPSVKKNRQYK